MKRILPIIAALCVSYGLSAQPQTTFAGKPLKSAATQTTTLQYNTSQGTTLSAYMGHIILNNPSWEMTRDKNTGLPIAIDGIKINSFKGDFSPINSLQYVEETFSLLQPYLKLKYGSKDFLLLHEETDRYGSHHLKFQQTINGVNIYGAQAWLHFQKMALSILTEEL